MTDDSDRERGVEDGKLPFICPRSGPIVNILRVKLRKITRRHSVSDAWIGLHSSRERELHQLYVCSIEPMCVRTPHLTHCIQSSTNQPVFSRLTRVNGMCHEGCVRLFPIPVRFNSSQKYTISSMAHRGPTNSFFRTLSDIDIP